MIDEVQILQIFVAEAEDDFIGLWEIVREIKRSGGIDLKENSLHFVKTMLDRGFVAGFPSTSGRDFDAWVDQKVDSVCARIASEWDALGRLPDIGDIVWFDLQ